MCTGRPDRGWTRRRSKQYLWRGPVHSSHFDIRRFSIVTRIVVVSTVALVALTFVLMFVVRDRVRGAIYDRINAQTQTSENLIHDAIDPKGTPAVRGGKLTFGGWVADGDTALVDRIKRITGADATIFAVHGGTPTRVSTTVQKLDGSGRAVNTVLIGPALAAFRRGEGYVGVNPIAGRDFIAHYDLVRDSKGTPIGILLTAVPLQAMYDAVNSTVLAIAIPAAIVTLLMLGVLLAVGRSMGRGLRAVTSGIADIVREDLSGFVGAFRALAQGDLRARFRPERALLTVRGSDEIAQLSTSYNALVDGLQELSDEFGTTTSGLRDVVAGVTKGAAALSLASQETSASTQQAGIAVGEVSSAIVVVAQGAHSTAERIRDGRTAVEELSRSAGQIAQGAAEQATAVGDAAQAVRALDGDIAVLAQIGETLAGAARAAASEAERGSDAVRSTSNAMTTLRDDVARMRTVISSLEERSTAVEQIVSSIEEIADQTNLLALNAAIEAARAGAHGRGFAVVAEEIRKLAEGAARSTREIAAILSAIRRETLDAATAMRSSAGATEDGLSLALRASEALGELDARIGEATNVAEQVADRAERMRAASTQLNANVVSVSAIVEENAAAAAQMSVTADAVSSAIAPIAQAASEQSITSEEVSAAAGELAAQVEQMTATALAVRHEAQSLQHLVMRFRTGDDAAPAAQRPAAMPAREVLLAAAV